MKKREHGKGILSKPKNKFVAAAWAILGGGFGCHWFYLGRWKRALPYIILSLVGMFLYIAVILAAVTSDADLQAFASRQELPPGVRENPTYLAGLLLMALPSLVAFVEGIRYLLTPDDEWKQ